VARWENALDVERMQARLAGETEEEADAPEAVLVREEMVQEDRMAANDRQAPRAAE
jgi:hypothetical protein